MHDYAPLKAEQSVGEKRSEKVIAKRYLNMSGFNSKRHMVNLRDS
jgi:hypothetical protein